MQKKKKNKKDYVKPTSSTKATYRPVRIGMIKYRSASAAVAYLLRNTKWSQVDIANKCRVTPACVCQLAAIHR